MSGFLPNVLDKFNTYAYDISIYICHPKYTQDFDKAIADKKAFLIVDQYRKADFFVQRLEQVFVPSYSKGIRSGVANTFEIEIVEPNGVSLLETIVQASMQLGIQNHIHASYFIRITFNGRTIDNNRPKDMPPVFYYPVVFRAFEMSISETGTQYLISAVETGASGHSYLEGVIKSAIEFEAANFGEFISELEKKINQSAADLIEMDRQALFPNTYELTFDKSTTSWKKWKFHQAIDDAKIGISTVAGDKMSFIVPPGTDLSDFIGVGLMCTEEYKQIPTADGGYVRPDGSAEFSTDAITKEKTFYKIVADVTATDWDPLRNDYAKKIQYKIVAYKKPSQIIDVAEQSDVTDVAKQKKRAKKLIDSGILRKRYDYLYTGNNTDVISLDIKFDHGYYAVSPIGGGNIGDSYTMRLAGNDETVKEAEDRMSKAKSEHAAATRDVASLRSSYAAAVDKAEVAAANNNYTAEQRAISEMQSIQRRLDEKTAELASKAANIKLAHANLNELQTGTSSSPQELLDRTNKRMAANYPDVPIRFHYDAIGTSDTWGPENSRDGGAIMFGAVKANLENAAGMLSIDMDIKGDPYWMGMPNTFRTRNTSNNAYKSLADYETGENMFLLNVNFPVTISNGRQKPRPDYGLTGVYTVVSVINRFQEGIFTQSIRAIRDVLSNVSTAPTEYKQK